MKTFVGLYSNFARSPLLIVHFGNYRAMLLVFRQNSMLFVVKIVKTLRFDDLAITRGVNVFGNSVEDQVNLLISLPNLLRWLPFLVTKTKSHWPRV